MKNKWSDQEAQQYLKKYKGIGNDLVLRTYSSRLLGQETQLVLHGGGNTSCKGVFTNILGMQVAALYVKASGHDLGSIEPTGHSPLDQKALETLNELKTLPDDLLMKEMRTHLLDPEAALPSFETLMHAWIPEKFIDHTHAEAILTLTNQLGGKELIQEVLGEKVLILDYVKPGFDLSVEVVKLYRSNPKALGMVLLKHGLVTWGSTAKESYKRTIDLVNQAEEYIQDSRSIEMPEEEADHYPHLAPILRGALAQATGDPDRPWEKWILKPILTPNLESWINSPPLTADYLIRTKPFSLWLDQIDPQKPEEWKDKISQQITQFQKNYQSYLKRYKLPAGVAPLDSMPRVIMMPGIGVVCVGKDSGEANIVRDITHQSLRVKHTIQKLGDYEGLSEDHLFEMEYTPIQHAKIQKTDPPLKGSVALVTGGAGAIGWGICQELLENGCHVAVTDLPGEALDACVSELKQLYGDKVIGVPLDVTQPESVSKGFSQIISEWGGIDIVIPNAGVAHVASLETMKLSDFQRLERVNIEGTLNLLSEASRHFKVQGTGGDIILISTKNVFSPGANFGAYSATKAAAHQLARIASLELAPQGVRVNMVSPDAVFSHQQRRSGLWEEVGPGRMKARGLDEKGLEEYYQNRNMLKIKITAQHVGKAVLFFVTHQTPTTGATIPVDGGLPDATPR